MRALVWWPSLGPQSSVFARGITVAPVAAAVTIVVTKVVLSTPRLATDQAAVAITWVVAAAFVGVGLVLLATEIPPANGWACLVVATATIPGDLNDPHFVLTYLTPLGYVLEPLYLPAAVALVLRYPRPRLTGAERLLVGGLVASSSGFRIAIVATSGSLPDNFYRPPAWPSLGLPAWWHDWALLRLGDTTTVLLLVLTAFVLTHRVFTAAGLTRQSLAPLAVIGAICAVAAAIDQAIWALNLSNLRWIPAALVRDLSAAAIPVALLADLLRRRAAAAAVSEHVIAAARSGDTKALQTALRKALVDPTLIVAVATDENHWIDRTTTPPTGITSRRNEMVMLDDGTPLIAVSLNPSAVQDEGLLRIALAAVRVGAENIQLNADLLARMSELRESRARIVEAGLAERRRVERDLHDGAQQQFLAVAATLARAGLEADSEMREVVADAQARLAAALRELRQLARGIHPAALSQGGLPAALPSLCAGVPYEVEMRIDPGLGTRRPPPGQESAVYFFVAEALTNAVKHAQPHCVTIEVRRVDDRLQAEVADDGSGGARVLPGGGLAGLADRVEALSGTFRIHSDPCPEHPTGSGTTLAVELPLTTATS